MSPLKCFILSLILFNAAMCLVCLFAGVYGIILVPLLFLVIWSRYLKEME